ncbi:MAG: chromate transporter [Candidatus Riflebacteria bacterium]|nr:chromate transporter [Candidatus Riflebacteria bacterium]
MNELPHPDSTITPPPGPIRLTAIFWAFARIGAFTLGGGLAMATVMRHELVLKQRWLTDEEFLAEMAGATVVPGPIAVNLAFLQGRRFRGWMGALAAVVGTVLPSFLTILAVALFAVPFFDRPKVATFFQGCAVAVAGQLAFASYAFGRKLLRDWRSFVVCAAGLVAILVLHLHPVWTIVVTGVLGLLLFRPGEPAAGAGELE